MKIYKILTIVVLFTLLISGCVSVDPLLKKFESNDTKLIRQHIAKGESLEKENLFSSALEQYKLALTIDPENKEAAQHKKSVLSKLWEKAQLHYKTGMQFEEQGKHESARKEYLSALQNWPDYKEAKERLTPGGVVNEAQDYILHTLAYGESVSMLGMIYYGDFKKHSIIGKFNVLKDVTKVRVGETLKIPVIEGFSLLDLKQKKKNYLNSRKLEIPVAVDKKPEKETKIIPEETSKEPETILQPVVEEPEPKQETIVEESVPEELLKPEITQEEIPQPETPSIAATMQPETPSSEKKLSEDYDNGIKLFNKKRYSEAIPLFLAAAEIDSKNETLLDYLFQSHFQQGLNLFNSEDYLSAKDNFESALKYDKKCEKCPDYIEKCETTYKEKHYNLGIHYFGKELLNKAIEEWKLVKNIDPGYKDVTPNLQKAEMLFKRLESIKQSATE